MYDSTLNHLNRRAKASGIDPGKLQLQLSSVPTFVSKWVIEVVYNGKDDEIDLPRRHDLRGQCRRLDRRERLHRGDHRGTDRQ
jgi:hypothetical protein